MRIVNVVAKFLIQHNGPFLVDEGVIKIFGADDATAAVLQSEFTELQLTSPPSSSTSSPFNSILSTGGQITGDGPMELDEAISMITAYLNALDQQEFTVVSAFKDELTDDKKNYKIYMWTLQK